ncbi:MAG: very short patch repair endonuclease [Gemmatimonadaceae bacterium]
MKSIRGSQNRIEVALRHELWRQGFRYRLYRSDLPGRPDLAFFAQRVAVFVDGDFWHGRALREGGESELRGIVRGPSFERWREKLAANVARDDRNTSSLCGRGWTVVRVWESEVLADPPAAARRIARVLRTRGSKRRHRQSE